MTNFTFCVKLVAGTRIKKYLKNIYSNNNKQYTINNMIW